MVVAEPGPMTWMAWCMPSVSKLTVRDQKLECTLSRMLPLLELQQQT